MPDRKQTLFVGTAIALDLGLGLWLWALDPKALRHLLPLAIVAALWLWIEAIHPTDSRRQRALLAFHRTVLGVFALLLALKMGLRLAYQLQLLEPGSLPVARRLAGVLMGSLVALWGNTLPKLVSPWAVEEEPFDWQRVHRFVAWVATLSGLAIIAAWLVLPIAQAPLVSAGIMLTFTLLALARKLTSINAQRPRPPRTAS